MEKYSTVVIGGGAAGICAAISKARQGTSVIICEKTRQLGKKILATGNGRCNLLNDELSESYYNSTAKDLVRSVFIQIDKSRILSFFKNLGLEVFSQNGRIFPITNQAASVLKVLEIELNALGVPVELDFDCNSISSSKNGFIVSSKSGKYFECRKVVIAGGGKTYPAFGSDGSIYEIVKQLGHTIIDPVPAAVPLVIKDNLCRVLQGQRISASARSIIEGKAGEQVKGELLFTKYGLSGTCILDVSEEISVAINRYHRSKVFVAVDMVPFMDRSQLKEESTKRQKQKWPDDEMLVGILPNKIGIALKEIFLKNGIDSIVNSLKDRHFLVDGTRGWNEAEFTSGGVNVEEVKPGTLESKLHAGMYFAGELLDVNGKRGGYNLGWAWASGLVAGQTK